MNNRTLSFIKFWCRETVVKFFGDAQESDLELCKSDHPITMGEYLFSALWESGDFVGLYQKDESVIWFYNHDKHDGGDLVDTFAHESFHFFDPEAARERNIRPDVIVSQAIQEWIDDRSDG